MLHPHREIDRIDFVEARGAGKEIEDETGQKEEERLDPEVCVQARWGSDRSAYFLADWQRRRKMNGVHVDFGCELVGDFLGGCKTPLARDLLWSIIKTPFPET